MHFRLGEVYWERSSLSIFLAKCVGPIATIVTDGVVISEAKASIVATHGLSHRLGLGRNATEINSSKAYRGTRLSTS